MQEERRVLRPSHSLGWGNAVLSQFCSPSGVTLLPGQKLCVADTNNHRLQVLSMAGEVQRIFGQGPGSGIGDFQQPTGLACDGESLYVADSGNCRLKQLALPDGNVISTVGVFGYQPGQLHAPVGITLQANFLFCADSRNHRICVYATQPRLHYITSFCSRGSGTAELGSTSSGIYIDVSDSELFIADRSNHRLQVLSLNGAFQRSIGRRGTAPGCFRRLRGVAVSDDRIFTAECERVQVLTIQGMPLQVLPFPGSSALVGICADCRRVYVVDQTHQKIRVLNQIAHESHVDSTARIGDPNLAIFLSPTGTCDSEHPSIVAHVRRLVPASCSAARAAMLVCAWVRAHIRYALHDPAEPASLTLIKREGTSINKVSCACHGAFASCSPRLIAHPLLMLARQIYSARCFDQLEFHPVMEVSL